MADGPEPSTDQCKGRLNLGQTEGVSQGEHEEFWACTLHKGCNEVLRILNRRRGSIGTHHLSRAEVSNEEVAEVPRPFGGGTPSASSGSGSAS